MPPEDLHHAMHTLRAALMFHRGGWSEAETERVRRTIEAAAEGDLHKDEAMSDVAKYHSPARTRCAGGARP